MAEREIQIELPPVSAPVQYVSAVQLAGPRDVETVDYTIPGIGTVALRPIIRKALLSAGAGKDGEDNARVEARMLVAGVAIPALTLGQAMAWQNEAPAGEIGKLLQRIREISGLAEDAGKS